VEVFKKDGPGQKLKMVRGNKKRGPEEGSVKFSELIVLLYHAAMGDWDILAVYI
jgi:hypothetical protein